MNTQLDSQALIKLFGKYRAFIWPVASILIALLLFIFVIIPQIITLIHTNEVLNQTSGRINALNNKAAALSQINTTNYTNSLNVALAALPTERDLPAAISQIQSLLGKYNLQLEDTSFSGSAIDASKSTTAQSFQIKLDVLGDLGGVKSFANGLKTTPEIIKLTGIDLSGSRGGLVQATITLMVYYQLSTPLSENVEQPLTPLTQDDIQLLTQLQQNIQSLPYVTSTELGPRGKVNPFQ